MGIREQIHRPNAPVLCGVILMFRVLTAIVVWAMLLPGIGVAQQTQPVYPLWHAASLLHEQQWIDLTHAFEPGIPHFPAFPDQQVEELFNHIEHGFLTHRYSLVGQWGTHIDAPRHFHPGKRSLDEIPVTQMLLPLVVIDLHEAVLQNQDTMLAPLDVEQWEKIHGQIPEGAFVAMRSDWSQRWPNTARMANKDAEGVSHYPGWSLEALKLLFEERNIVAIGHETTDTDPGIKTSEDNYEGESYVLSRNCYQIELMANLDQCPPAGALILVSWPKPHQGTGFPVRVVAICRPPKAALDATRATLVPPQGESSEASIR